MCECPRCARLRAADPQTSDLAINNTELLLNALVARNQKDPSEPGDGAVELNPMAQDVVALVALVNANLGMVKETRLIRIALQELLTRGHSFSDEEVSQMIHDETGE
jgi:hypothetical protein